MKITVFFKDKVQTLYAAEGQCLLDILLQNGIEIPTACGKRGTCKKCKVQLLCGEVEGTVPDAYGWILSCKAYVKEPISIAVGEKNEADLEFSVATEINQAHSFGVAFDLGTTTLAFSLVDLDAKATLAEFSTLNPQKQFGADVISRISAANDGHLSELHQLILKEAQKALAYFKSTYGLSTIETLAVAGNTTMLHIFLNISPKSIGFAPYTPVFTEAKTLSGASLSLDCTKVEILPSFSAFVGADIAAGAYAVDLPLHAMLIDLGTNGELLYRKEDGFYSTSTAAGPCLEGASMDCGIGGIQGAIRKVSYQDGAFQIQTIAQKQPCGICGAGYVDAVAALLNSNQMDETGALLSEQTKLFLAKDIYISDADIRKFQLAKSAICSGIYSLLHEIGVPISSVSAFYLAGGIGSYVDVNSAVRVGLLPKEVLGKIKVVGNSCLRGAEKFLCRTDAKENLSAMTAQAQWVDLNQSLYFNEAYIENMMFL